MTLDAAQRRELLSLARCSIESSLRERMRTVYPGSTLFPADANLQSSFVTLRIDEQLRGCCGTIDPQRPLGEDVWRNAWSSAFSDPRFLPLTAPEYPRCNLHISVLGALEPLVVACEAEPLHVLRPHADGLVLEYGDARSTFLPAVWEQLPRPAEFVRQLKLKAGWPGDFWSPQLRAFRYPVEEFGED